ncbi:DUF389 domain-containing protein [Rhodococcus sp. YH3-3]|uniref:DUF389 domain-containing protein n=1 Tax=Rhodococcus sp. YH3-3 TaxID=1803579 RepID=UPI0009EF66E7
MVDRSAGQEHWELPAPAFSRLHALTVRKSENTGTNSLTVGVFISVTTVPAAGFAVVAAANGEWRIAGLSSLQLAVNLLGIVTACVLVLWLRTRADEEFEAALKGISRFVDEDKTP